MFDFSNFSNWRGVFANLKSPVEVDSSGAAILLFDRAGVIKERYKMEWQQSPMWSVLLVFGGYQHGPFQKRWRCRFCSFALTIHIHGSVETDAGVAWRKLKHQTDIAKDHRSYSMASRLKLVCGMDEYICDMDEYILVYFRPLLHDGYDHTNMTAPLPVRSAKLSMFGPG